MAGLLAFLFVFLAADVSYSAPVADFIEFTPIAAVPDGYTFGTSEIKIDDKIFYTLSFKKGRNVFALVPDDMLRGTYPVLKYTGLAINNDLVVIGGKEKTSSSFPWVFLFQIQKERVAFLDVISAASINDYIFNFEYQLPDIHAPNTIKDNDKDKLVEFGLDFFDLGVTIYTEITNNGFKVDYTSKFYNNNFNNLDLLQDKDEYQLMQYLVYGTLAKRLDNNQAYKMYVSYIRESNYKLKQLINNMRRIKEIAKEYDITGSVMEYLMRDIEQEELFSLCSNHKSSEFQQRILLLDEQLKLLKIDEVVLNDFSTYVGGYLSNREFEEILTRAVVPFNQDVRLILSNILILDNILHKYGYKIIYLKAGI